MNNNVYDAQRDKNTQINKNNFKYIHYARSGK